MNPRKEEIRNNNSFFEKSFCKYRSILETIFVYGCYDKKLIAEKCGCSEDKVKKAKEFYEVCLAEHLGMNYMIRSEIKKGRPSSASYLNYRRFSRNRNFLYSAYLWSSTVKKTMWRYAGIRQYINYFGSDKVKLDRTIHSLCCQSDLNKYFGICFSRNYESVKEFLDISDKTQQEYLTTVNSLCDALSVFAGRAPYSVPAYSIMSKLKKTYNEYDDSEKFERSEICDLTYDNYDKILCDDAIYSLIQAIRKKQPVSYTQSSESQRNIYIIPLKIMREFISGRSYLIHGYLNSDSVCLMRIDKIFKVKAYDITDAEMRRKINEKIKVLRQNIDDSIKNIWLTEKYNIKNNILSVRMENISEKNLEYIKKYSPNYEYSEEENTVTFRMRRVNDIKPFIRTIGGPAVISKNDSPNLFNEFAADNADARKIYEDIYDLKITDGVITQKTPRKKYSVPEEEKVIPEYLSEDKKSLELFNKFNSFLNLIVEDLQYMLIKVSENDILYLDINKAMSSVFKKYGLNYYSPLSKKITERFIDDSRKVIDLDDGDNVFFEFPEINGKINISLSESEMSRTVPAQIFTDYEYEYLYLMLRDELSRSLLDAETADRLDSKLSGIFTEDISINDIYLSRFSDSGHKTDTEKYRSAMTAISEAVHNDKKISFIYNGKNMVCSPYRLTYSLRECVPRLIISDGNSIKRINVSEMKSITVLSEKRISDVEFEKMISGKRKYIELFIPKTQVSESKNVFERTLRLFSSYEKYTWDDQQKNAYAVAIVYYDFDLNLSFADNIHDACADNMIISDILSLGKYAVVLPGDHKFIHELPEDAGNISYGEEVFRTIKSLYTSLDKLYNQCR